MMFCFPPLVLSLALIFPPICCCCCGSRPHSWSSARRSCSMCSLLSLAHPFNIVHMEFCPHLLKNCKLHLPKSSGNNTSTARANNGSTERVTRAILVKWNHFNHSSHSEILHSLHSHAHSSVLSPDFSCFFMEMHFCEIKARQSF